MNRRLPIQNIPIRSDLGRKLRKTLLSQRPFPDIDYASIEKQILEFMKGNRR